ncbi:Tim17-domain-containing protein [Hymenopellis radicata]|nr:Tim17-domain-containing protein [Hymenopellis radicata]
MSGVDPRFPFSVPIYPVGKEPLPPGFTEDDREAWLQTRMFQNKTTMITESAPFRSAMAGVMGFGIGGFFSLMTTSFQYEDPLLRQQAAAGASQKFSVILKDMGKGIYSSGKGFAKVGALYAGIECVIEGYRAKNDIYNSVSAGFITGSILGRNAGPRAALGGGLAFAAFSAAIDLFLRREPPDDD